MLQAVFEVWNSFKGYYGMCLKWFGQECLKGLRVGTQSAEVALFLQFESDFCNGEV